MDGLEQNAEVAQKLLGTAYHCMHTSARLRTWTPNSCNSLCNTLRDFPLFLLLPKPLLRFHSRKPLPFGAGLWSTLLKHCTHHESERATAAMRTNKNHTKKQKIANWCTATCSTYLNLAKFSVFSSFQILIIFLFKQTKSC